MIGIRNIAETYTPEMALFVLLCRLAFSKAGDAEVVAFLSEYKIDWEVFSHIVSTHQLRPTVYKSLSEVSAYVDPGFFNVLKQDTLRIAAGNLVRLDEMLKIHAALVAAGVSNIPYKGVLLSQYLYGDFVTRETGDIDIMIRSQDLPATYHALLECGYNPAHFFDLKLADRFVKTECELMFVKNALPRPVKLEIHWEVTHEMMRVPLNVEQLFTHAKNEWLLGRNIQVLDVSDVVAILMTHHGVNDVWRTFRHVADVAALIRRDEQLLTSAEASDSLHRYGLRKTSSIGMQLCYDLFGVGAASSIHATREYKGTLHQLLNATRLDRHKLSTGNIRRQFMLRDSFTDKLRLALAYAKVALTPNIRDVQTLSLPRSLHFLYYFLKPFLFLVRRR